MESILSMTGKELLKQLRTYEKYQNQTDYYIKKEIGGKKLATVDELKTELTKLSTLKPIKNVNHNVELPEDIIYNLLLNADIKTINNLCQTNKIANKYCKNKQFWFDKFNRDNLPQINLDSGDFNWINGYNLLLKAHEDAKLMILLTDIEENDETLNQEYDMGGEGTININFNESIDDDRLIRKILPDMINSIHEKYNNHDLVPNSIQLVLNKPRISYSYELIVNKGDFDVERIKSSKKEMMNVLTYFIFYMYYGLYDLTFTDENNNNIIYEPLERYRKFIIKVIKNIQHKQLKI
jgi:hypothetical protein